MSTNSGASWAFRLPLLATLVVAIASGALAAVATHDVAVTSGAVTDPRLAWLLPGVLEGGAITASGLAAARVRAGQSALAERLALTTLMMLAAIVNATHALDAHGTPLGVVLAACPPPIVVGSIEMLIRSRSASEVMTAQEREHERIRARRAERAVVSAPKPASAQSDAHAAGAVSAASVRPARSERDTIVDALVAQHGSAITEAMVIKAVGGISRATAGRLRRAALERRAEAA